MNRVEPAVSAPAADVFADWLDGFGSRLAGDDAAAFANGFADSGHWKDILAFTWEHRTFSGQDAVRAAFAATWSGAGIRNVRVAEGRTPPSFRRRSGQPVLEGFFDFDTVHGRGSAFVRLIHEPTRPDTPRVWILLTTLQEIAGHEEKIGLSRPSGDEFSMNRLGRNWRQERERRRSFADREPQVVVVGAGQAGLTIAARLGQLGVDTLVVERTPRVGDIWRERYESLTLHNETMANHLPYLPFPETWPLLLTKDQMANWLEAYAELLEVNVWTGTRLTGASYDAAAKAWTLNLEGAGGEVRPLRCRHLIVATGASGGIPHVPHLDGLGGFGGEVIHSAAFRTGADYTGRKVIVVGTGNSGHDIAQDLVVQGADAVHMLQRGPTCVVSLEPTAAMVYKPYASDMPTEDVDLMTAAAPYPVLEDAYRWITERGADLDREMLDGLDRVGFKTYFGSDGTGFQMMFMRGEGGYYIDVGCVELIVNGMIGVVQTSDADRFVGGGLRMKDGTVVPCDAVVLATGFRNMQETVRAMLGDDIADRVGPLWGFDEHCQMRNMWRRTAQPGLWFTGGALLDSRLYSRFLALEIRADLDGKLPDLSELPLAGIAL